MNVKLPDGLVAPELARPGDVIGWRRDGRPIRLIGGGAEDDSGDDDELDTGGDDPDDDDDQGDDDPEALKARITRMEAALRKANKEAERHRQRLKKRQANSGKGDDDSDTEAAAEAAEAAVEAKLKRAAAVAALAGEGLTKAQAKLAARMLDVSDVELDDDGDGDFSDAIDDLRDAFPQLFRDSDDEAPKPKRRPLTGRITTADKGRQSGKAKLTATDRAVKALIG